MSRLTSAQKILRAIQKSGSLNALTEHNADDLEISIEIQVQVNASINDNHYEMPFSLDIDLTTSQDNNDTLGKLVMTGLELALFDQTVARNTGKDTPHSITFQAKSEDDWDEWDTDENPPQPAPRQRKTSDKPKAPCLTGQANHRWFQNKDNPYTFTCEICKQTRKHKDLTKSF